LISRKVKELVNYIEKLDGINNKTSLIKKVLERFNLTQDRKIYYCDYYALRFSYSSKNSSNFSNTVISLSSLQKYDEIPFIVCLVTPKKNYLFLANTTLLKKVSHSSQELRVDNIKGSINGSDILKELEGIKNCPDNFDSLFDIHSEFGFSENLPRLVESTNNIVPKGHRFCITEKEIKIIQEAPTRAMSFVNSDDFILLKTKLDSRVEKYYNEILIASYIENTNIRGRIIEYLVSDNDEKLKNE
jgi:hypothetical protein